MATPNEKLAASLAVLQALQRRGRVFRSNEISRVHRERLVKNGFLLEVAKGWLISSSPGTAKGDSTPWFASFWEFCAQYCDDRFGAEWHLSPEQSLLLHAENTIIPAQLVVYSPKGTNNTIKLLFDTSIYGLKQRMPAKADLVEREGLRLFSPAAALIRVPEAFFARNPVETQIVLSHVKDASVVLNLLLEEGRSVVAGRLAGAFRRIGRDDVADEIVSTMKSVGYVIRESDPFAPEQTFGALVIAALPIVGRIHALWEATRGVVVDTFPKSPGLPKKPGDYLRFVDDIYASDAYHSLSIEGYNVTPDLIERVRSGVWNPNDNAADAESKNALAARGYWQAFQLVKKSVAEVIGGKEPGALIRSAHREWYRELFQPFVMAGIVPATALAGYRRQPVYLRGSRYVPPRAETVSDAMSALFDLLEHEPEPSVRAVLGHWLFGYIHPYPDGNGRMARFVMNVALASGGYPWTIIRVEDRDEYLNALDSASIDLNIAPFAAYVAERVRWSMRQSEKVGKRVTRNAEL
ncbi:MAG: Fic family protein [Rhizomicrobium sp.]|nr:Fic family protein [Rhizomicrobium sp.]